MIPIATTTVALLAPKGGAVDTDAEDWGTGADLETDFNEVASGIRAHLSGASSSYTSSSSGGTELIRHKLLCDPCELRPDMYVKDESTELVYAVGWVTPRPEPLAHLVATLTRSTGTS